MEMTLWSCDGFSPADVGTRTSWDRPTWLRDRAARHDGSILWNLGVFLSAAFWLVNLILSGGFDPIKTE